jgi:hypothetical protein
MPSGEGVCPQETMAMVDESDVMLLLKEMHS